MSNDRIGEESEKSALNSINLLASEEKPHYVSLLKQIIVLDENLHRKSYLWRVHQKLLQKLRNQIQAFPVPEASLLLHETMFEYAKEGIKPLQFAGLEVLASLVLYNYDMEEADAVLRNLVAELAEADSSHLKCLFVDLFEICATMPFTIANIEDKLFSHLVEVSECSYKSVKLRILKSIPKLKYLLTDSDILEEVQSILIRFSDDRSEEVWIKAEEMKLLLFKWKKEAQQEDSRAIEIENSTLFNEREQVIKEVVKVNKVLIEERAKKEEENK